MLTKIAFGGGCHFCQSYIELKLQMLMKKYLNKTSNYQSQSPKGSHTQYN